MTLAPEFNKDEREVRVVARYAAKNLLAGKPILVDARYGRGHMVLFGFRPQFRGQTHGTFPLLLDALD